MAHVGCFLSNGVPQVLSTNWCVNLELNGTRDGTEPLASGSRHLSSVAAMRGALKENADALASLRGV